MQPILVNLIPPLFAVAAYAIGCFVTLGQTKHYRKKHGSDPVYTELLASFDRLDRVFIAVLTVVIIVLTASECHAIYHA